MRIYIEHDGEYYRAEVGSGWAQRHDHGTDVSNRSFATLHRRGLLTPVTREEYERARKAREGLRGAAMRGVARALEPKRLLVSVIVGLIIGLMLGVSGVLGMRAEDDTIVHRSGTLSLVAAELLLGGLFALGAIPITWLIYPDVLRTFANIRRTVADRQRLKEALTEKAVAGGFIALVLLSGAFWYWLVREVSGKEPVEYLRGDFSLMVLLSSVLFITVSFLTPILLLVLLAWLAILWPFVMVAVLWWWYGPVVALLAAIVWLLWRMLRVLIQKQGATT